MNQNNHSSLLRELIAYSKQDYYPFHMPGHKRSALDFADPWAIDITEIDGFDNLHHPTGLLADLEAQAASLYHTRRSFCLVGGSTCGILAAISACVKPGGTLLLARNCHKSVYHAVELLGLTPVYIMPQLTAYGILGSISPDDVRAALHAHSEAGALLITSPTYDGIGSDIRAIADLAHAHQIPLIVDEAHGAHLPLFEDFCREERSGNSGRSVCEPDNKPASAAVAASASVDSSVSFPQSALSMGADLVIHSLHKTLPAFTQTALLHCNSHLIDPSVLAHYLDIYETSSPSYLLLSSIDVCFQTIRFKGKELFFAYRDMLSSFYQSCEKLSQIRLFPAEWSGQAAAPHCFAKDPSKILIFPESLGLSGPAFSKILNDRFHLVFEMAAGHYILALTGIMDRKEGFHRLRDALFQLDSAPDTTEQATCGRHIADLPCADLKRTAFSASQQAQSSSHPTLFSSSQTLPSLPESVMTPAEAMLQSGSLIPLSDAAGRISRDYLTIYPPGIPLAAPGERIDDGLLSRLMQNLTAGATLEGTEAEGYVRVL